MKVKDFINKLNELGYNDETEIVFNLKNEGEDTYKDYYCQSIYTMMPFTYNAIGIDIDDCIKGRRLTDKESKQLMTQDTYFNQEEFEEVVKPFCNQDNVIKFENGSKIECIPSNNTVRSRIKR